MKEPEFSVVIPLYNKQEYIAQSIQSVLNQKYQNFEIIIINDGSTDRSVEIVGQFDDERIRLIQQDNQGVSVARNRGIRESKANNIAFLDADDEWHHSFLEEIKKAIANNPNYIAYVTNRVCNDKGDLIHTPRLKYVPKKQGVIKNYYKSLLFGSPVITSSSVCLNKSLLQKENLLDLFPINVKRGEDLDAWTKINLIHYCYFINKRLAKINYDEQSASRKKYKIGEAFSYSKWFSYKSDSWHKTFYLYLLAIYRIIWVWAKVLGYTTAKKFIKNILPISSSKNSTV